MKGFLDNHRTLIISSKGAFRVFMLNQAQWSTSNCSGTPLEPELPSRFSNGSMATAFVEVKIFRIGKPAAKPPTGSKETGEEGSTTLRRAAKAEYKV